MDWKALVNRIFPPFTELERQRPREMLYVGADRLPWPGALSAALQHALLGLMFVIYSVITAEAIGLEAAALRDFVAIGILIMGLGTLLNGLTTRMSAGHLLVYIPTPLTMGAFIATTTAFGPSAAAVGVIVLAVIILLMGRFLPLLRPWFPAEISGIALILLGMTLVGPGIERAAGLRHDRGNGDRRGRRARCDPDARHNGWSFGLVGWPPAYLGHDHRRRCRPASGFPPGRIRPRGAAPSRGRAAVCLARC